MHETVRGSDPGTGADGWGHAPPQVHWDLPAHRKGGVLALNPAQDKEA